MIDHLISQHGEKHVAYIYGDYRDQRNQTIVNIIGSLLKQLLTIDISNVLDAVISVLEKEGKRLEKHHILQMVKFAVPQLNGPSFLCIDALDELEPRVRHELLKVLQSEFGPSRIFITGRPHIRSEVNSVFQAHQHDPIHITADLGDVRAYLTHEIELDMEVNPEDMNEQLKEDILKAIINQAKGM